MNRYTNEDRTGEWIGTYSGGRFWLTDPRVEDINGEDIAYSLAKNCRFTGHTKIMYTVAQHSLLATMEAMNDRQSVLMQLYVLLHDGSEAYLNDISRPLKATEQMKPYLELEDMVQSVVWDAFGLPQPTDEDWKTIRYYDDLLLANEIGQVMNNPQGFGIEPKYNINITERNHRSVGDSFVNVLQVLLAKYELEKIAV